MSKSHFSPILLGLAMLPGPLAAQSGIPYQGAFARAHPEASALLRGFERAQAATLDHLYAHGSVSSDQLEDAAFDDLVDRAVSGTESPGSVAAAMPALNRAVPGLAEIFDRGNGLRREIYDIYTDDRVVNKAAAVDGAVDRYRQDAGSALSDVPKAMQIIDGESYSTAFRTTLPKTNGVMWASHWLQLALYDPMMYYATAEDRRAGIEVVVDRFRAKLDGAPESLPTERPTPAAISPELARRFPRAAVIFDNLHLLHDVVADLLVHDGVTDERLAIEEAIAHFADPEYLAVQNYDWMVMSLRHGIYNQGGPAIGTLERSERNVSGHGSHGAATVFSGMGSGPGGESVVGDADPAGEPPTSGEPDSHADH